MLADAQRVGDLSLEVSALTDLGLIALNEDNGDRALALLEDAIQKARLLGAPRGKATCW